MQCTKVMNRTIHTPVSGMWYVVYY